MARWKKLGVVAGAGALPDRVARACIARGEGVHVVRLAGIADENMAALGGESIGIAEVDKIVRSLKGAGCDALVLAGLVRRPDFRNLTPDWRGAALLPKVLAAAARGDGAILAVLVEMFESEGFLVVGAEEAMQELAARSGPLGAHAPSPEDFADIRKAAAVVAALGPFDVGQAAVVAGGHVVAIEAAEGTDAMLERCALLKARGAPSLGVLVKRPKPGQELRVDLPTIGVESIRRADAAGLRGVAVEAGAALVIDAEATAREADARGLFIYGFEAGELIHP